jgi:hypothetical protein
VVPLANREISARELSDVTLPSLIKSSAFLADANTDNVVQLFGSLSLLF